MISVKMTSKWSLKRFNFHFPLKNREKRPATAAPSPIPSRSASPTSAQQTTQPTSQPPPSPPTSTDAETSPLPSLPERIWNQAYDELKENEPKLVEAYEKILSVKLHGNDRSSVACESTENEIKGTRETRCRQMQRLVQEGLGRTQNRGSINRGIGKGLQAVQTVRGIVDKAVQAAPEAAIAWVGVCLGLEILSNTVTESRDNREGMAYVLSRMDWYWNLVSLLLDENKKEQSSAGLRVQLEEHVVQLYEKLLSYQVKSVCLYHRNWGTVVLRDGLRLDDWAGRLDDIKEAEAAVQRDMDQYNTVNSKRQFRELTDAAHDLAVDLQHIHSAVQDQTRQQDKRHQDDKDKKCEHDLFVTDPRKDKERIKNLKGGLLENCYCWILGHADYLKFRDDQQSRLLWITGDPGKGKTMLLCGIIDELEKGPNSPLSYFFCQATEPQLNNAVSVLRGLIYLLIIHQESLISYVRSEYDHTGEKLFQGSNVWVSLVGILTKMLEDPILKDVLLVVDALDECITDRPKLLDFIVQTSSSSSSHVKWIISSRNEQDIQGALDYAEQKVRLHLELNPDSISKAVGTYIKYKVGQLARRKNYDTQTRDAISNHLTSNANDTFLWVALVCQELADSELTRKRHTLAKLKSFPPGLNPLYKRMMEQISNSDDADICKEILATASVVYRPITLEELKVLAPSLEDDDYDDLPQIISSCGSFLTLREGVIYLVHQSAKEFLLNEVSDQVLTYGEVHQHHAIFSKSLTALSQTLQRDICKLNAPGFPFDKVLPTDLEPLSPIRYSCVYWVDHLHVSVSTEFNNFLQDNGIVHRFIKENYLYWLECLGLLRSMSEGVRAMNKLEALVRKVGGRQLTELVRDARRFILSHKRAIEIAPLQAYASALVFSPEHSLTRELFKKEEPDWMVSKPRMEAAWNACLQTLEGHGDSVTSVVFSTDGQRLASGSRDKTVKIWDAATGACEQTLEGHGDPVTSVVFSADGQRLASGSHDGKVKIWDAATGTCMQTLEGHGNWVNSVVFSADGKRLASGSDDNTVKIWDAATGACEQTLEGHGDPVTSVVFSADGQRLASGSCDNIKIWDAATGTCMQTLGHSDWVNSVVFSADGQRLASGSCDNIKIWDAATGTCMQTLEGHGDWVTSVVFSADGQRLASGSYDETVKIWDAATGVCEQTLEGHGDWVWSVVFSADGQRLASGLDDKTVKIWDAATGACKQTLEGHDRSVTSVVFSADGQRLASGSYDNTVKIWDAATGACEQTLEGHGDPVTSVVFSADGQRLASGLDDKTVKIWDAATGACKQTLEGHDRPVTSVVFSADGQRLASGSDDNTVKIWDAATGVCEQTLEGHGDSVMSVVFSADGQRLASGSHDRTVKIWDAATGACKQTLKGHGNWVRSVVFSADGQRLASGSGDKTVKIWDAATGVCEQTLEGHGDSVTSVVFSADGQRLASGSGDKTVKIWDAATGACEQTLNVGRLLYHLSFDPTSNALLSTDIGLLNLDRPALPPVINDRSTEITLPRVSHSGWGISADGEWIVEDGKKMLWLPPDYRGGRPAIDRSTVAIGCRSGRVLVMKFS
ncbi:hypothetical protein FPOA_12011 [Fusarium poae]|uniref:NACHT domain-containing protein n=1 Tax=Fusarium poae TaxID=36050 RepID=A0A1B8AAL4_FUSPO|nr:hypothetical protein FPOA_12011 [Fusarium poae]